MENQHAHGFVGLVIFISIISLLITAMVPGNIFYYENNPGAEFFITFLFILKSVIAIFIYYGFSLGKNCCSERVCVWGDWKEPNFYSI